MTATTWTKLFVSMLDATPDSSKSSNAATPPNHVLEAEEMIAAKAASMLRHYVDVILPNGFKAQVVAVSRKAAVRYRAALVAARDDLVAKSTPARRTTHLQAAECRARAATAPIRALPYRDLIARLDAAAVISGAHNDNRTGSSEPGMDQPDQTPRPRP